MKRASLVLAAALVLCGALPARAAAAWSWPLRGEVLTSYRNGDDPYAGGQHRGIDIAGDEGAPVVAAAGGTVVFAGAAGWSGQVVTVRTADGRYDTSYLHLAAPAVREGQSVAAGERIGAVGTTGRRTLARSHLHFSVRDAGSRHAYHDPLAFLPAPPGRTEPPRGAPAPVPAPRRVSPAPDPVRGRAPARKPARAPARSPAPVPAPRRAPARLPVPRRVPHGAPAPGAVPAGAAAPRSRQAGRPEPARSPIGKPAADPATRPTMAPAPVETPADAEAPPRPAAAGEHRGPDLGWVLACLGLLLAAGLVGGTDDGRRAVARGRERIAAFLRPLGGRA